MVINDPNLFLPKTEVDVTARPPVNNWLNKQFINVATAIAKGVTPTIDFEAFEVELLKRELLASVYNADQVDATIEALVEVFTVIYHYGLLVGGAYDRTLYGVSYGMVDGAGAQAGRRVLSFAAIFEDQDTMPITLIVSVNAISQKALFERSVPLATELLERERSRPALRLVSNGDRVTDAQIATVSDDLVRYKQMPGAATWIDHGTVPHVPMQLFHRMTIAKEVILAIAGYFVYEVDSVTIVNESNSDTVQPLKKLV